MRIEIRAGEGGGDAATFASELAGTICAYLRRTNRPNPVPSAGPGRTVVIDLPGPPDPVLSRFAGTHRIQRIPANDRAGRRHTSTATVAVLDDNRTERTVVSRDDCRIEPYRGSGPGGQHRNTNMTDVRVTHLATGITVVGTGRSQWRNIETALVELACRLEQSEASASAEAVNDVRRSQFGGGERPVKAWTWNQQRSTVTDHATGATVPLKALQRGRLDMLAS